MQQLKPWYNTHKKRRKNLCTQKWMTNDKKNETLLIKYNEKKIKMQAAIKNYVNKTLINAWLLNKQFNVTSICLIFDTTLVFIRSQKNECNKIACMACASKQ